MTNKGKWDGIVQLFVVIIVGAVVGIAVYGIVQFNNITSPPTVEVIDGNYN